MISTATQALLRRRSALIALATLGFFVSLGIVGPLLVPVSPNLITLDRLVPPGPDHLLGTDHLGRDILSRFVAGTRVSLLVGICAVVLGSVLGTLIGLRAGLKVEGWWDAILMRLMDVGLTFPLLIIVPVLAQLIRARQLTIGPISLETETWLVIAVALGVAMTPDFARIARSGVMAEMQEMYIAAARAFGVRGRHLLFGNLLPNILTVIVVQGSFSFGRAIIAEAGVSFLGLGIQPPNSSWGLMLADGQRYIFLGAWWLVVVPSTTIAVLVLAAMILGDSLRTALDPKSLKAATAHQAARPLDDGETEAMSLAR